MLEAALEVDFAEEGTLVIKLPFDCLVAIPTAIQKKRIDHASKVMPGDELFAMS